MNGNASFVNGIFSYNWLDMEKKKIENFMSLDALLNELEYADRTMELNKIVFAFQYL